MILHVKISGLLSTVQDLGREGYRQFGLPVAGAMDPRALVIANMLARNNMGEAALEITLTGPTLEVEGNGVLALAGGDLGAELNGWPLPANVSFAVQSGDRLRFTGPRMGCRAYLAASGGFELPQILGSSSTYLRGFIGGLEGRALRPGDVLHCREPQVMPRFLGALPPSFTKYLVRREPVVRAIPGPQDDYFDSENLSLFFKTSWLVGSEADRMGYRLSGATIKHRDKKEIISDGILSGAVQVPGHGTPIVLLADAQTSGGYPKIATVIGPDLGIFGQLQPGDYVRFAVCSSAEALGALLEEQDRQRTLAAWLGQRAATQERRFEVVISDRRYRVAWQQRE